MTKEQFKAIAKVCMKAKAEIDNILEENADFNMSYHHDVMFFDQHDELNSFPICDIDEANITEYHGFHVYNKKEF